MIVTSSTFNSNGRVPSGPWVRTWLLALLLIFLVLGTLEVFWRTNDFKPSIQDGIGLWCQIRRRVRNADSTCVAILGDSRTQLAIDPQILAEEYGGNAILMLAKPTTSPLPLIRHLARDTSFRGTILCGVNPTYFFNGERGQELPMVQAIEQYNNEPFSASLEQHLCLFFQSHLRLGYPVFHGGLS